MNNEKKQLGIRLTSDNYQKLIFLNTYFQQSLNDNLTTVSKSDVVNYCIDLVFKEIEKNDAQKMAKIKKSSGIDLDLYRDMSKRNFGF
jgi:hypothetical protein